MSLTVIEVFDARALARTNGENRGARIFKAWDDASPITSPEAMYPLFGTGGLPNYGDIFPGLTSLAAQNVRVTHEPGQTDTFVIEWEYGDSGFGPTKQPYDVGYVEIDADASGEFRDGWRSLSVSQLSQLVASGGLYEFGNMGTQWDIGGTSIDSGGAPTSLPAKFVKFTVGVTKDVKPLIGGIIAPFISRRNNTVFWGAPVGTVVFIGAGVRRMSLNRWSVQYRFVLDSFYHLIQVPYRLPDGSVRLDTEGTADHVFFVQPFPEYGNFYALDPAFVGEI